LTAGSRQLFYLKGGSRSIGGIRVRHGLHDDRVRRPDGDVANEGGCSCSAGYGGQGVLASRQVES